MTHIFLQPVRVWEHKAVYAGCRGDQEHHVAMRLVDVDVTDDGCALETEANAGALKVKVKADLF